MKTKEIRKRSGGIRKIYVPSEFEKEKLREILPRISQNPDLFPDCHGFMPYRNAVTNAIPHLNKGVTVSFDLSNFFDSVTPKMLAGKIPWEAFEICFPDGAARQGLPTSPAISNIAAKPLDEAIQKKLKIDFSASEPVYTRYADDLSISLDTSDMKIVEGIKAMVKNCVSRCGFKLNDRKTKIQWSKAGRREICGIVVDHLLHPNRRFRKRLRAVTHLLGKNRKTYQEAFLGMSEWNKLKVPNLRKRKKIERQNRIEARIVAAKNYLARSTRLPPQKIIQDQDLGEGIFITTDPVMIYGMSVFTTGWTSCMDIQNGTHDFRKGVVFWERLSGVSLAYQIKDKSTRVYLSGISRPAMKCRCLVYSLRSGEKVYGQIYSSRGHYIYKPDRHSLAKKLSENGFNSIDDYSGGLVEGYVPLPCPLPYFDDVRVETIILKDSKRKAYRVTAGR